MNRRPFLGLALCCACASAAHTRVLVEYAHSEPVERVAIEAVNATGRELPMPPASLVEQAVRIVTQEPEPDATLADAFARAVGARLADLHVGVSARDGPRLRVSLTAWDVRGGDAAGAVVFVSADYVLLGEHDAVLWQVRQDRLPVRLSGPNLSRYEVGRVAATCVAAALASWPGAPSVSHR